MMQIPAANANFRPVVGGPFRDVHEVIDEIVRCPAPLRVRSPEQDPLTGLQFVPVQFSDGDLDQVGHQ
jgi:hypothetical protein